MKNMKGFTLIEILVVIVLIGILGLILTSILSQVLRGQNKINTVSLVKQNGQVVLDKLSNEIRSAEKVICAWEIPTDPNNTIVIFKSGNYTRFRFIPPTASDNGYLTREDFTKDIFPDTVTDKMMCSQSSSFVVPVDLTDKGSNGVSIDYDKPGGVSQPIFTKQPQAGSPDIILIRFRASEGLSTTAKTPENTVSEGGVLFTTAAAVRGGK